MPLYEYTCKANGKTLEVRHSITEDCKTWGEVCERAGRDLGNTPADAEVERGFGGGMVLLKKDAGASPSAGPAPSGPCNRPGGCGCH